MLFHAHLHALYFVAFSIIIVGLIIFNFASVNVTLSEIWQYVYHFITRVPYQPASEQGWIGLTDEVEEEDHLAKEKVNKTSVTSKTDGHSSTASSHV
jgi:hypothetical protein